jgi:hypothetical protein
MKFTLSDINDALKKAQVPVDKIDAAAQILQQIAEDNKPDPDSKGKRLKKEIFGFVADNGGPVDDQTEQQIWLVQANEGIDHTQVTTILTEAGKLYNESIQGKKKKNKIVNFVDHFALLKPKFTKDKGVKILTKEAIILTKFTN